MATRSSKQPDLTIVIPAYREEKRIGATLDELATFLKKESFFAKKDIEVLVVSADSPDKTHEIVMSKKKFFKNLTLLKPGPKVGKGRDVQFGMLRAHGKLVVYMDADLATPLHHLERFYKACDKGADVVIGTRNLFKHHHSKLRMFVSNLGNALFKVAAGLWIEDSQCGFKMFSAHACRVCFDKMTIPKWGFDMEVLAIAKINSFKIKSYRISDWRDMPDSTFTDSVIKNSLHSLKDLAHIVHNRVTGLYHENHNS